MSTELPRPEILQGSKHSPRGSQPILVEFWRAEVGGVFAPGGVALAGGAARYTEDAPREFAEGFIRAVQGHGKRYLEEFGMTWRQCFIRMSLHGVNGYFVWREMIDVPEDMTLDQLYEHYITRGIRSVPVRRNVS